MNLFDMKKQEQLEQLDKAIEKIKGKIWKDSVKREAFIKVVSVFYHDKGKLLFQEVYQ
jgi:hypothetical protein